ncbi:MAG: hypothetical protein OXF79_22695, partial [Chloroflexi bacterium]|nr:hypothetical protein [Chloroflexota bacterium]
MPNTERKMSNAFSIAASAAADGISSDRTVASSPPAAGTPGRDANRHSLLTPARDTRVYNEASGQRPAAS